MVSCDKDDMSNRAEIIYDILSKKVENASMQINYSKLKSARSTICRDTAISCSAKIPVSQKRK